MPPACAIVLAGLCLQAPHDRVTNFYASYVIKDLRTGAAIGVAQPREVRALGARIDAYQSDSLQPHDASGLARACVKGSCLLYAKTCAPDELTCEWDWGVEPAADNPQDTFYTRTFIVTATTREAMARAVGAISIQPKVDSDYVEAAAMSRPSAFIFQPACGRDLETGCNNSPASGLIPWALRDRPAP